MRRTRSCGSAPPSPRRPASTAVRASSTTPAPSSPSPRGTTWRAGWIPPSWPAWSGRGASRMADRAAHRGGSGRCRAATGVQAVSESRQALLEAVALDRGVAAARVGRSFERGTGADRAHRPGSLPPRASGLVHRRVRPRQRVGYPRLHRAERAGRRDARCAGRPLHARRTVRRMPTRVGVVDSIVDAVDGARVDRLVDTLSAPGTALVTLTITEGGYAVDAEHRPDLARDDVVADVSWLRTQLGCRIPGSLRPPAHRARRLLVGLEGRRRSGAGTLSVLSCDNLPANGELTRTALLALAEMAVRDADAGVPRRARSRSSRHPSTGSRPRRRARMSRASERRRGGSTGRPS